LFDKTFFFQFFSLFNRELERASETERESRKKEKKKEKCWLVTENDSSIFISISRWRSFRCCCFKTERKQHLNLI